MQGKRGDAVRKRGAAHDVARRTSYNDGAVVMKGWLEKKGKIMAGFQRRWFVAQGVRSEPFISWS